MKFNLSLILHNNTIELIFLFPILQVRRLKFREDTQRGDFQGTPPEEKRGQNLNPVQILKSALSPPFCGQNQLSREFAIEGPPWAGPFPIRARIYSLQGGKPLSKMKK